MTGWRRRLAGMFVVLFLVVQLALPAFGLYLAHEHERGMHFSWQMFSRLPANDHE